MRCPHISNDNMLHLGQRGFKMGTSGWLPQKSKKAAALRGGQDQKILCPKETGICVQGGAGISDS